MSQGQKSSSIMKSSPNSSKLCLFLLLSRLKQVAFTAYVAKCLIFGIIDSQKLQFREGQVVQKYFCSSAQDNLLAFQYLPYYAVFFWIASFVRCIRGSLVVLRLNSDDDVLTYPSSYQYPLKDPLMQVISIQCRISNFLLLQSMGFQIYFCKIKVRNLPSPFLSLPFSLILISSRLQQTVMPLPRLVFYPGLTIQMFLMDLLLFFFSYSIKLQQSKNLAYSGSSTPLLMWNVSGSILKGFQPLSSRQRLTLQNSAFLLPIQQFYCRWLCIRIDLDQSILLIFFFQYILMRF